MNGTHRDLSDFDTSDADKYGEWRFNGGYKECRDNDRVFSLQFVKVPFNSLPHIFKNDHWALEFYVYCGVHRILTAFTTDFGKAGGLRQRFGSFHQYFWWVLNCSNLSKTWSLNSFYVSGGEIIKFSDLGQSYTLGEIKSITSRGSSNEYNLLTCNCHDYAAQNYEKFTHEEPDC